MVALSGTLLVVIKSVRLSMAFSYLQRLHLHSSKMRIVFFCFS